MIRFEGYNQKIDKINSCLKEYGFKSLEEARDYCLSKGIDVEKIVRDVQPIAFDNAVWAFVLGCAIALKKGIANAAAAAERSELDCKPFARLDQSLTIGRLD